MKQFKNKINDSSGSFSPEINTIVLFYFDNPFASEVSQELSAKLKKIGKTCESISVQRDSKGFYFHSFRGKVIPNREDHQADLQKMEKSVHSVLKNTDLCFSIGGDGTFLFISSTILEFDIPLIGINMGHIGFLTWFDSKDTDEIVSMIGKKALIEDHRMMLDIELCETDMGDEEKVQKTFHALNEVSLTKYHLATPMDIFIYIDNEFLSKFKGDGIIISTPTGSTGYSLSAGGPIICPTMVSIIITPINAHSFTMKPIIIQAHHEIRIAFKRVDRAYLTIDGQRGSIVHSEQDIVVGKSEYITRFIRKESLNFYKLITHKLNWGGL